MMSVTDQKEITEVFEERTIAYNPGLTRFLGGLNESIILMQLIYWHKKTNRKDGYMYKTVAELEVETAISANKQRRAFKSLEARGYIQVKLKGIPAKRHIKLDLLKLRNDLEDYTEDTNPDLTFATNLDFTLDSTITESTTENTQESTTYIKPRIPKTNATPLGLEERIL